MSLFSGMWNSKFRNDCIGEPQEKGEEGHGFTYKYSKLSSQLFADKDSIVSLSLTSKTLAVWR